MNGLMGRIVHQSFEIINIIVCECGCFAKRVNWDSNNIIEVIIVSEAD